MKPYFKYTAAVIMLCALFPLCRAATASDLKRKEVEKLFTEANQFFQQGNQLSTRDSAAANELYRKAILRYERIINQGGISSGRLLYNTGNAYFRIDDLGRAILYYRRALRLIPNDNNLMQNLTYARSRRMDKVEESEESKVLKTVLFWHYDFSLNTRIGLFLLFFTAFWLLNAVRLFRPAAVSRWLVFGCAFIWIMLLASVLADSLPQFKKQEGVIVAAEVIGRKGDDLSYQPSFKEPIHSGAEFTLLAERRSWYQIELPDGKQTWIPAKAAEII